MYRKIFIIVVTASLFSLASCTSQALKGVNATDCKSVQQNCSSRGVYDEWFLEGKDEVSCSCRTHY